MRYVWIALLLAGPLACPSMAAVDIKIVPDSLSIDVGETTTVRLFARGTVGGIASAAGYVLATTSDGGGLKAVPGSFVWASESRSFLSPSPFPASPGQAGTNGGWGIPGNRTTGFGSMQANYLAMDKTFGQGDYVALANYRVTGTAVGHVTLTASPDRIRGFRFVETTRVPVLGQNVAATIRIVPQGVKPFGPGPIDNRRDVPLGAILSWNSGQPGSGTTFDVYLDTVNPPVQKVAAGQTSRSFTPGALAEATCYYWMVVAIDSGGVTAGPVWSFATHVPGDANVDGYVNVGDLQALVAAWGSSSGGGNWNANADLNNDGHVNVGDLQILVANWGRSL